MKYLASWAMAAGIALTTAGAQAQAVYGTGPSMRPVSDVGAPYVVPPPPPRYGYGRGYGYGPGGPGYIAPGPNYGGEGASYGPSLLPPTEVYAVLRDNGFSPLGIPRQRGYVYVIAVIDRGGEDGRLVIDARDGRIIRFIPAYRMRDGFRNDFDGDQTLNHGRAAPVPPAQTTGIAPRPPGPGPQVASRAVPLPKASPLTTKSAADAGQRSAAVQPKAADTPPAASAPSVAQVPAAPPAAASTVGQAAASPLPTQEMPSVQGLE